MGGSGVRDSPQEFLSIPALFDRVFPEYLAMGMTYRQFWIDDCRLVIAYREAYRLRQEEQNRLEIKRDTYTTGGSIDFDTAEKYVDWYYENGLDGIFAVCQSSEIFYLSLSYDYTLFIYVILKQRNLECQLSHIIGITCTERD